MNQLRHMTLDAVKLEKRVYATNAIGFYRKISSYQVNSRVQVETDLIRMILILIDYNPYSQIAQTENIMIT